MGLAPLCKLGKSTFSSTQTKPHARHVAWEVTASWISAPRDPWLGIFVRCPPCTTVGGSLTLNSLTFSHLTLLSSPARQAVRTQTVRSGKEPIRLANGGTRKGTSGFQEPTAHVLTLTAPVRPVGFSQ